MRKKTIIFGTNLISEVLLEHLKDDDDFLPCGYCLSKDYIKSDTFEELPVVPLENVEQYFSADEYVFFITVGYSKMNKNREKIYNILKEKGYTLPNYVHPSAIVLDPVMGDGNLILERSYISRKVKIGSGNIIYAANIGHHATVGNFNFITMSANVVGDSCIGNNCMIGVNAIVKNNVNIADFTLVGSGAYVNRDTAKNSVYVPSRSILLEGKNSLDIDL